MNLRVSGFKNKGNRPLSLWEQCQTRSDVKDPEEELRKESWLPLTRWNDETYLNFKELFHINWLISEKELSCSNFGRQTKRGLIKSSINPLPPGGLISNTFGGRGLIEKEAYLRGGGGRGLAYLFCEMVVSVIHKELEWAWKSSSTRKWRSCSQGSKTNPN